MYVQDLMIGDWVRIIDDDTQAFFDARVEGIDTLENIYATMPCDETAYPYSVDCAKPIPLTPEILEKNGFKDVSNHTLKGCETYELSFGRDNDQKIIYKLGDYFAYESYDDRWYRLFETQICHKWCVHHLQHALRLCGIEKEIVL